MSAQLHRGMQVAEPLPQAAFTALTVAVRNDSALSVTFTPVDRAQVNSRSSKLELCAVNTNGRGGRLRASW